ncbi:hypothetical protein AAE02nite_24660 [Adhaeribacter aerolatus]|uniref:Uncharacterized protein n=1 Tax=Adhaeribacter aerolatus TaxID=670289 RepID=A0A512AYJ8_9BACT|nr:hypothetical protein [Adhaeribacter aerolatus]GEO04802.1 hypothetical protein AAE02nite_24660 [Adhaeribacter aerolatus]
MKVRILANTLRFRLRQPEVQQFQQQGKVTETTAFGPDPAQQLHFCLEVTSGPELTVCYQSNTATIGVPRHLAEEWTGTALVGLEGKVDTGKGQVIEVLVEKDFVCLDRPEEENSGAYPNPKGVC